MGVLIFKVFYTFLLILLSSHMYENLKEISVVNACWSVLEQAEYQTSVEINEILVAKKLNVVLFLIKPHRKILTIRLLTSMLLHRSCIIVQTYFGNLRVVSYVNLSQAQLLLVNCFYQLKLTCAMCWKYDQRGFFFKLPISPAAFQYC